MASNGVVVFHFQSVCVLMSISAAYVTIGSYIRACQPITDLLLFTREDTLKKCRLSMSLHECMLQLLEMSSFTKPNHVCTRYNILRALFYEKYWRFLPVCDNEKISTVIACKRNRFDFWNSCKRLQKFVNVEALEEMEREKHCKFLFTYLSVSFHRPICTIKHLLPEIISDLA